MRFIAAFAGLAGIASASVVGISADSLGSRSPVESGLDLDISVDLDVKLNDARKLHKDYKCPHDMTYCPWTKSCSCAPGQKLDPKTLVCVGEKLTGAWPEPDISLYGSVDVKLGTYCALTPTKIVKYDPKHKYCQAGLNTITFCAAAEIETEIRADVEIDLGATVSADLKNVCGALSGLYLESVIDAVILFNTDLISHGAVVADVQLGLGVRLFSLISSLTCALGFGECKFDCVAYCTKGCPNYIDVVGELGGRISGLVGLCILPKVILVVNSVKAVVNIVVDSLLCLVGGIVKTVLSTFDCHCK